MFFNALRFLFSGAGLLQHYIREGKTKEDITRITYNFCTSFKIQTPRVCEGITELFGVSSYLDSTSESFIVFNLNYKNLFSK
jgi:hypothetical protein